MRRALVLAVALGMSGSAAAFADSDVPGADWMPEDQVIQKLGAAAIRTSPAFMQMMGTGRARACATG